MTASADVDVSGAFTDPDGDPLTYTAKSSDSGLVWVRRSLAAW